MSDVGNEHDNLPVKIEQTDLPNGHVRLKYRIGEVEMEVEGPPDYVEKHAALFLEHAFGAKASQIDMVVVPQYSEEVETVEGVFEPENIIEFFVGKGPKNQSEEIAVITYYFQLYEGKEAVALEDYADAYRVLRRIPVKSPSNLKSSVYNTLGRSQFIYSNDQGEFGLTLAGREVVETMTKES